MNKNFLFALLLLASFIYYSQPNNPISTKYLEFRDNDSVGGLCDLNGKIVVDSKENRIRNYCDNYYIALSKEKGYLYKISGELIYTFPSRTEDVEILPNGALVIADTSHLYIFNKILNPIKIIPYNKVCPVVRIRGNILAITQEFIKDSVKGENVFLYDIETLKLKRSFIMNSNDDKLREEHTRRPFRKPYFKIISSIKSKKANCKITILDSLANLIFEHIEGIKDDDRSRDAYEAKGDKLYQIDWDDRIDDLIEMYYKGANIREVTKNIQYIKETDLANDKKQLSLHSFNGELIKKFPPEVQIKAQTFGENKEIVYFEYSVPDTVSGYDKKYYMNTQYKIDGNLFLWFESKGRKFDSSSDFEDYGLIFYNKNKTCYLKSLITQKKILAFKPNQRDYINSKGLLPIGGTDDSLLFYKEKNTFGMMNVLTGKKTEIFNFTPPSGMKFSTIDFNLKESKTILEAELELVAKDTLKKNIIDTTFTFIRNSKNQFVSLGNLKVYTYRPYQMFDTINSESSNFELPFYDVRSDSLIIMDKDKNFILKEYKKKMYWVSKKYLGLSNGKRSTLYNIELKIVKQDIPGAVCAAIDDNIEELICYEAGAYYLFKGGKSKKLFSENELMGWPKTFVNHPDSSDYRDRQMIVNAERHGNKLLLYQRIANESAFKLALYDIEKEKLLICPNQMYLDGNSDNEIYSLKQFENRYKFLKKQFDSTSCFSHIFKPKFIYDTLDLYNEEMEMIDKLGEKYKDFKIYSGRKSGKTYHFGTTDSIYYSFTAAPEIADWDCGIIYLGNNEEFYLIDQIKHQISADRYTLMIADQNSGCDNENFAATNLRTKKNELFIKTEKGTEKIFEGEFKDFSRFKTGEDGLGRTSIYYIFTSKGNQSAVVTDDKFKLLYDTAKYELDPNRACSNSWEEGFNMIALIEKSTKKYFLYRGYHNTLLELSNNKYYEEFFGDMHLVQVQNTDKNDHILTDWLIIESGEFLKGWDANTSGEPFLLNGKMYYTVDKEDGSGYNIYDSKHKKIR